MYLFFHHFFELIFWGPFQNISAFFSMVFFALIFILLHFLTQHPLIQYLGFFSMAFFDHFGLFFLPKARNSGTCFTVTSTKRTIPQKVRCGLPLRPAGGGTAMSAAYTHEEETSSPNIESHGGFHWEFTRRNLRCWRSNWRVTDFKNSFIIDPSQRVERLAERTTFQCDILSVTLKWKVGLCVFVHAV